ncbi:hypothetical protein DL96DRAFT_1620581 [Flagelloscypha sp. PMI_526]|nr:hypothetical protein DL96DRAFT_1620581 [Flagelloscypha sp. PMI_526]
MTVFPYELYEKILSLLEKDFVVLAQCTTINKAFRLVAQRAMWQSLTLHRQRQSIGHIDTEGKFNNDQVLREFLDFLQEEKSHHLFRHVLSAQIEIDSLMDLRITSDFGEILTYLINLRVLTLHTQAGSGKLTFHIPAAFQRLLMADTVWPHLDTLSLQGVDVQILEIMSSRPHIQHLGIDSVKLLRRDDQVQEFVHSKTSLRTLSLVSYHSMDVHSSSPIMDLVRGCVSRNTLKSLYLGECYDLRNNIPSWLLLFSAPMLKICAPTLTALCLGYEIYHHFAMKLISKEDLSVLNLRHFRSLHTLKFDILLNGLDNASDDGPTSFLFWLSTEVESISETQGQHHPFSDLILDFFLSPKVEKVLPSLFGRNTGQTHWRGLDNALIKASAGIAFSVEVQYFQRFEGLMNIFFPLCSAKGMARLKVSQEVIRD